MILKILQLFDKPWNYKLKGKGITKANARALVWVRALADYEILIMGMGIDRAWATGRPKGKGIGKVKVRTSTMTRLRETTRLREGESISWT